MVATAYRYQSDDGNTYQVVLPSDFASQLGYVPATGSEPYLPSYISMRYSTYQSPDGVVLDAVYVTFPFATNFPPPIIQVSGLNYVLKSSYGEVRGFNPAPNIITIAGPQGPPGANASGGVTSVTAGTGIGVTPNTGAVVVSATGPANFQPSFSSSFLTLSTGVNSQILSGLSRTPFIQSCLAQCFTNDANTHYVSGDELVIPVTPLAFYTGSTNASYGIQLLLAGVNITPIVGTSGVLVLDKTAATVKTLTLADWRFSFQLWD